MKKVIFGLIMLSLLIAACVAEETGKEKDLSENAEIIDNAQKNTEEEGADSMTDGAENNNREDTLEIHKETDHFKIFSFEKDKPCLDDLGEKLEAAYSKVTADLDNELDYKVEVRVYPDLTSLHRAVGFGGGTGQDDYMSAFAMGKRIYIVSPLNPGPARTYEHMVNSSTFHEFTHVVINDIKSSDLFPSDVPRWLNEGIASYQGGPPMAVSIMEQQIKQHIQSGNIPTLDNLSSYGRDFTTTGGYFFTYPAGKFLVDTYGFEKVKQLIISPDDFEGVFGKSEQEIWEEWVMYLKENYG